MDEQSHLILDTRRGITDLTNRVSSIRRIGYSYQIAFNNASKVFNYACRHITIKESPKAIASDVQIKGKLLRGTKQILLFDDYLKIFYADESSVVIYKTDFKILQTRSDDILKYLYAVARLVKTIPIHEECETMYSQDSTHVNTMVSKAIEGIIHEQSFSLPLQTYLTGEVPASVGTVPTLIFPFPCNESQLSAVEMAFTNPISIIQGPPGTGKTQTILNILANAVMQHKTIAVVSNNNSAIQNVMDKLAANGLRFLVASLGNNQNRQIFQRNQPNYPSWLKEELTFDPNTENKLKLLHCELLELFHTQNKLKKAEDEIREWRIECQKYKQRNPEVESINNLSKLDSDALAAILVACQKYAESKGRLSFFFKLWMVLFRHAFSFRFWNQPLDKIIACLKWFIYTRKEIELSNEIAVLKKQVENSKLAEKQDELINLSRMLLKKELKERYKSGEERRKFVLWQFIDREFLEEYPIILTTTYSLKNNTPHGGFDVLVMDEASQVDPCTGMVALSSARQTIIVGDDKQLPCVVTTDDIRKLKTLEEKFDIASAYRYHSGQSILSSLQMAVSNLPNAVLREHYRCHPFIIGFCNKRFYDNQLVVYSKCNNDSPLHVIYTTSPYLPVNHVDKRQAEEAVQLQKQLIAEKKYEQNQIGICAPYRNQALVTHGHTVHSFQGREVDAMIFTTVDASLSPFVAEDHLVNVIVSRAKKDFYLLVSSTNTAWDNCVGDLVKYIQYYGNPKDAIQMGKVSSVFDCLYGAIENQMQRRNCKYKIFDSPAEEIIWKVIKKVLHEKDITGRYELHMHIPLYEIFMPANDLSTEENNYLTHSWTHVDFLIYEKYGKTPCYAIEVDGYNFHKKGTKQYERDILKNNIFQKRSLPLLRLSTRDVNEYNRISEFLFPKTLNN